MKTKILLSVVAVLFVAVLYLLYLNLQKTNTPIVDTQLPVVSPTKVIDQTVGWKTYTDKVWNYSVKYPSGFKVITHEKPIIEIMPENNDDLTLGNVTISLTMNQEVPKIPSSFSNADFIDTNSCGNATWAVKNGLDDSIICWKYNRDVRFSPTYSSDITKDIYYQIVSTFKFNDKIAYKTYTGNSLADYDPQNPKPKFTVNYPENWILEDWFLYPEGKNSPISINLMEGGRGDGTVNFETRKFPAGTAEYIWYNESGLAKFSKDGIEYMISITGLNESNNQKYQTIFNDLLNSFKFVP